ncbi:MAG TPA: amidohydrolase family protein [Candidatus Eisenbacteria bacterium]|nr:amidohydrolase family protein [Candidatus Eisenbacteria bacterium]
MSNGPMEFDTVIRNGKLVIPPDVLASDIGIKGEKIAAIATDLSGFPAKKTIDARGNYVLPGAVDPETHLGVHRSLEDDFISETRAAVANGVTTWGMMLTSPTISRTFKPVKDPEDSVPFSQVMSLYEDMGDAHSMVDYFLTPLVSTDAQVEEIPLLADKYGATSYKYYLHLKRGQETLGHWEPQKKIGVYGFDDGTVYIGMEHVGRLGPPCISCIHPENWEIIRVLQARLVKQGRKDTKAWDERCPHFVEAIHVRQYAYLAQVTNSPLYIVHTTTPESVAEIKRARSEGVKIIGETGFVYLTLDHNAYKINVPLRDPQTMEQMWKAVADGDVDCVGSDHVNHGVPREQMEVKGDVWKTISGFSSRVEAMLPLMLSEGVNKGRITLPRCVEFCCENPARAFGLFPKKGVLRVGADADIVLVDLKKKVTINKNMLLTSAGWSIFEGWEVTGWPYQVFLRGQVVSEWNDREQKHDIVGRPRGRYQARKLGYATYPLGR